MKKPARKKKSPRFISRAELLRMQVASAESIWKDAKEHLSRAKRRRKLAKLMAKRAKTDAKQAKAKLAEAREALALADAHEDTATRRITRRKTRTTQAASKAPAARKRISKGARLIRARQVAEAPAVTVLPETIIREANDRASQSGPGAPAQS